MPVLSELDRRFWDENGYVVVPDAVPEENLRAVIRAVSDFLEIDPNEPASWYSAPPRRLGFVEMYHHQALWDNRQYPRLYEVFREIWGMDTLWVSFDRANMTPPERPDRSTGFNEPLVHWDFDASLHPGRLMVQGVLYLTDTEEDQGGFQCVPGFHNQFHEWVKTQPLDRDPHLPDLTGLTLKKVPGKAGDLAIWHSLLPHGNSRNTFDRPRWSQYIQMTPAREDDDAARKKRIAMWRDRLTPPDFPRDPRRVEQYGGRRAKLTRLGRKLLGLDRW